MRRNGDSTKDNVITRVMSRSEVDCAMDSPAADSLD